MNKSKDLSEGSTPSAECPLWRRRCVEQGLAERPVAAFVDNQTRSARARAKSETRAAGWRRTGSARPVAAPASAIHAINTAYPKRCSLFPLTPRSTAKSAPSFGFFARYPALIVKRADVTNKIARSGPPKVQLVGQVQGRSTTRSIFPSGNVRVRQAPPATRAVQMKPSASRAEPSGTPRSNPA